MGFTPFACNVTLTPLVLLACLLKMQQFESTMCPVEETVTQATNRPVTAEPVPTVAKTHKSPPIQLQSTSIEKQIPSRPQPKNLPSQNASSTGWESSWPSLSDATSRKHIAPASSTVTRSFHQPNTSRAPELSSAGSVSRNTQGQSSSGPSQPSSRTGVDLDGDESGWVSIRP